MSAIPFLPFVFRSRSDVQTRNAGIELGIWISLGYLLEALGLLTSDAGRALFLSLFTYYFFLVKVGEHLDGSVQLLCLVPNHLPRVAVVGRPNVGKSALFN